MAFSDIPSKLIERTEALTESKLSVAAELTKLICTHKNTLTQEEVFEIFFKSYNQIKNLAPQPLEKISLKKILYGSLFLSFVIVAGIVVYFLRTRR
jgi:hypothetical protein